MSSPYGYWEFAGKNGLEGAPNATEELPDGRLVTVKDPTFPAVLQDQFILYALSHSRRARYDFNRLFPQLDPVSQERLTDLILLNKRAASLILSDQEFADAIQEKEVTAGVRTRLERALRI